MKLERCHSHCSHSVQINYQKSSCHYCTSLRTAYEYRDNGWINIENSLLYTTLTHVGTLPWSWEWRFKSSVEIHAKFKLCPMFSRRLVLLILQNFLNFPSCCFPRDIYLNTYRRLSFPPGSFLLVAVFTRAPHRTAPSFATVYDLCEYFVAVRTARNSA